MTNVPTYEELRQAVLTARGENLAALMIEDRLLRALIDLGVLVRIGGGLIEVTSHGDRLYQRLQRGEHARELDPS